MQTPSSDIPEFRALLASSKNIIILSGSGLSAPSGIATYRGPTGASLWSNPTIVKYSRHDTFKDDPSGSWQFYHHRRVLSLKASPNPGHLALISLNLPAVQARITPSINAQPLHITQNIDDLSLRATQHLPDQHVQAAKDNLIQMHGSLFRTRCLSCKHVRHSYEPSLAASLSNCSSPDEFINIPADQLPRCGGDQWNGSNRYGQCGSLLRPDVVWFGEVPPLMGEIARKISQCDLLIVVGTSSVVQPASRFASQVRGSGGKVAVFNLERSRGDEDANFLFLGSCEVTLPEVLGVEAETEALREAGSDRP